jgi:hypothetical protein
VASGRSSLSDALVEILAPFSEVSAHNPNRATFERLVALAMGVWNATLPRAQPSDLRGIVDVLTAAMDREVAEPVIEVLAQRRRESFGDDNRVIAGVKVLWEGDVPQIVVTSAEPK